MITARVLSVFKLLKRVGFAVLLLGGLGEAQGQPEAWQEIYSSDLDFFDVHFMDSMHGIVTNTNPPVSVYKTYDGGFTWEPSIMWIDFYTNGEGIEFYNERIGYLIGGGRSASTTDGGENWTIHYHGQNHSIEQVAYIDSLKMIAVGSPNHGPDSTIRRIFRSMDGGTNWAIVVEEIGVRGFNYVVSVAESLQVVSAQRGDEIWRSTDQGLTWSLDAYSSNSITDMCSPAPNTIIASGFTLPGHYPAISRSTDGGLTWVNVFRDTTLAATIFLKIDFPDSVHGWAVGYDGFIAETEDGGETWGTYYIDSIEVFLTSVSFIDSLNGWAVDPTGHNGRSTRLFRFGTPQGIGDDGAAILPDKLLIHSAYPNPFNSTLSISLDVPLHQDVTLSLYDLLGREVDVVYRGRLASSTISYVAPAALSSGVYFLRASAGTQSVLTKVVLLK